MNKILRITLIVIGVLVIAGGLVFTGAWIGDHTAAKTVLVQPADQNNNDRTGRGYGMMQGNGRGSGQGYGMMGNGRGSGMMNGYGYNNASATPLTVDQAYQAAGTYLSKLNNPDLKIAEVMVFDNNAYVRVIESSTGIGAFELLVNPSTLAVTPEPGPNMMWNLKYGGMVNMMGGYSTRSTPADVTATMAVSSDQALQAAQQYLDTALPGAKTAADADPFYGYYTIDILRDGKIIGMLSVNGFNSQVFMHTWHGTFIATQDY
ncbi:MAG TPA: DUF5320 domain-containing protein [Anaerolineales bacterium]